MDELVAFLRAALDEEYALARRVADRYVVRNPDLPTHGEPYWPLPSVKRNWHFRDEERESSPDIAAGLDLIELYSPTRVLAKVEAKRRILDEHPTYGGHGERCATCQDPEDDLAAGAAWPCPTVRLLVQPYAGLPGWREEWADVR